MLCSRLASPRLSRTALLPRRPLSRDERRARLRDLHDGRVREEAAGHARWFRPDYQIPRFGKDVAPLTHRRSPCLTRPRRPCRQPLCTGGTFGGRQGEKRRLPPDWERSRLMP